jgi:6-phosphogluconolactonase
MTRRNLLWLVPTAAVLLFVLPMGAAAHPVNSPNPAVSLAPQGAVFTMTNDPSGNAVLAYVIGPGGSLIPAGHFGTHGKGTGVSLADQGALALTDDHRWLLVVDAGSNAVSVFHVNSLAGNGPILSFVDRVSSHGTLPVSIAIHGSFVYVLNAGTSTVPGSIFGFVLADHGLLLPLPGSSRALSTSASTGPAEVAFNPAGTVLVVTEQATSVLDTYTVGPHGYASGPTVTPSSGSTPYGFAFGRGGALVVSDAGPGALSSYAVAHSGVLTVESSAVADGQTAACWVVTVDGGQFAYTSNAHSDSISTYGIGPHGALTLLVPIAATTGAADTDLAVGGSHGHYLFVYDAGAAEIEAFAIGPGASLTLHDAVFALPATAEGLVAF